METPAQTPLRPAEDCTQRLDTAVSQATSQVRQAGCGPREIAHVERAALWWKCTVYRTEFLGGCSRLAGQGTSLSCGFELAGREAAAPWERLSLQTQ